MTVHVRRLLLEFSTIQCLFQYCHSVYLFTELHNIKNYEWNEYIECEWKTIKRRRFWKLGIESSELNGIVVVVMVVLVFKGAEQNGSPSLNAEQQAHILRYCRFNEIVYYLSLNVNNSRRISIRKWLHFPFINCNFWAKNLSERPETKRPPTTVKLYIVDPISYLLFDPNLEPRTCYTIQFMWVCVFFGWTEQYGMHSTHSSPRPTHPLEHTHTHILALVHTSPDAYSGFASLFFK